MTKTVKVGSCQTPEIIGDPLKALDYILKLSKEASEKKVDLLLFPECFLSGYILNKTYMEKYSFDFKSRQFSKILKQLINITPTIVFGISEKNDGKLYNSAVVVNRGNIIGVYRKTHLINPNELFFTPGNRYPIFDVNGLKYGINICYDAQFPEAAKAIAEQGANLLLLPAQNMIPREKAEYWKYKHNEIRSLRVLENNFWYVSSDVTGVRPAAENSVERICYGPTSIMNPKAEIIAQVPLMTTGLITADIPVNQKI